VPELPEVHTTAAMLNRLISGLRISDAWTDYGGKIHEGKDNIKDPKFFRKFRVATIGATIKNVERRGKNVLINLDNNQTILVHMKMTGQLLYGTYKRIGKWKSQNGKLESVNRGLHPKPHTLNPSPWVAVAPKELKDPYSRFIHLVISFTNGKHLALSDVRKFAKVTLLPTAEAHLSEHLSDIGPEPLEKDFDFAKFKTRLFTRPNGKIKQVLMDPKVVAGIGNIYSDEILFDCSVHPLSIVSKIPAPQLKTMFNSMKLILKQGIKFGGDSTSDYRTPLGTKGNFQLHHRAYQRAGEKCNRKNCLGKIAKLKLGGRTAHFCPRHQILHV